MLRTTDRRRLAGGRGLGGVRARRRLTLPCLVWLSMAVPGLAQITVMERAPELDRLEFLVGDWDMSMEATVGGTVHPVEGRSSVRWNPRRTWLELRNSMEFPGMGPPIRALEFVAWNAENERYEWTGIDDQSALVHSGTAHFDDDGVLVMESEPCHWMDGHIYRFRRTIRSSADGTVHETSEISMDGGPFAVNGEMVRSPRVAPNADRNEDSADPDRHPEDLDNTPLRVLDFYCGRLVGISQPRPPFQSAIELERTVGGRSLGFTGTWDREGQPREFVEGLMLWDPDVERIRIHAMFYHGAYFDGFVDVLDAERHVVERDWVGRYPDGRTTRYRERWTPCGPDEFEWKIELLDESGVWQEQLPPGVSETPRMKIHRD